MDRSIGSRLFQGQLAAGRSAPSVSRRSDEVSSLLVGRARGVLTQEIEKRGRARDLSPAIHGEGIQGVLVLPLRLLARRRDEGVVGDGVCVGHASRRAARATVEEHIEVHRSQRMLRAVAARGARARPGAPSALDGRSGEPHAIRTAAERAGDDVFGRDPFHEDVPSRSPSTATVGVDACEGKIAAWHCPGAVVLKSAGAEVIVELVRSCAGRMCVHSTWACPSPPDLRRCARVLQLERALTNGLRVSIGE